MDSCFRSRGKKPLARDIVQGCGGHSELFQVCGLGRGYSGVYKSHVLSIILRQHLPMVIKSYCFHEHQLTAGQLTGHFVHNSIDPHSYPCDRFLAEGELETWGD